MARAPTSGKRPPETGTAPPDLFTIGHSTRRTDEFLALLAAHGIARVIDVRTVPRSRHNPQFNANTLKASLAAAGVGYLHLPELGGLRHPVAGSPNMGWRNASFRGFADYMQTPQFTAAIEGLVEEIRRDRVALMCAEALPWRCHRSLVADALSLRGLGIGHIITARDCRRHVLTPFARVEGERITYPPASSDG
jgi:uncharacterized protein (DUF488 family)